MQCSKCGYENQNGDSYCAFCGTIIEVQQNNPLYQQPQNLHQEPYNRTFYSPSPQEVAAAESKSITSLVLGIISIVTSFFIIGVILAPLAMSNAKKARLILPDSNQNFWIALAGKITGIIGLVLSIIGTFYWIIIAVILGIVFGGGHY